MALLLSASSDSNDVKLASVVLKKTSRSDDGIGCAGNYQRPGLPMINHFAMRLRNKQTAAVSARASGNGLQRSSRPETPG
jgi:hypothetical protein